MKTILALVAFVSSTAAVAAPAVGDRAAFQGTWGTDPVYQMISLLAYNPSTRQFTQETTTKIGSDAPATQQDLVNYDDMASDAATAEIVKNCPKYNGTPETITVAAGTFQTCKTPLQGGGFANIGQVPFAVVRIEAPAQGKTLKAELAGFNRGPSQNP